MFKVGDIVQFRDYPYYIISSIINEQYNIICLSYQNTGSIVNPKRWNLVTNILRESETSD